MRLKNWANPKLPDLDENGEVKKDKEGNPIYSPKGKVNRLPSMTVPDQALSIKELIDKHMIPQNIPVPNNNDPELFEIAKMVKLDQIDYVRNAQIQAKQAIDETRAKRFNRNGSSANTTGSSQTEPAVDELQEKKTKAVRRSEGTNSGDN